MAVRVRTILLPLVVVLLATLSRPVQRIVKVSGLLRSPSPTVLVSQEDIVTIIDTQHCEDLHYEHRSGKIFTACDDHPSRPRFQWYPPLDHLEGPSVAKQGSLKVIDPLTMKAQKLSIENFDEIFVTHGIDLIEDPTDPNAVYIFVINHIPAPNAEKEKDHSKRAASRVELFHHLLGSTSVRHIRTIRHPLINTPNDIYAASTNSFYITNDHHYRTGLRRQYEQSLPINKWSDVIYVQFSGTRKAGSDSGVTARVALSNINYANGLGHVRSFDGHDTGEVSLLATTSGLLYRTRPDSNQDLQIEEVVEVDYVLDNPSYYSDPYASASGNASGYVLAGFTKALQFLGQTRLLDAKDPAMVTLLTRSSSTGGKEDSQWNRRLIFEDDGSRIRSTTSGVIVPIDPVTQDGRKRGWLFLGGVLAQNVIAVKVDL